MSRKSSNTTSISKLTVRLYISHAFRYKRFLLPLVISILAVVLIMDFLQPYIQSQVLQKVSDGKYDPNNLWGSFGKDIIAYTFAVISSGIIGWRLNIWLLWNLEMRVMRDIAQRAFEHLMRLDANFHANRFGGSLVSQANKLVGSYVRFEDVVVFNLYTLLIGMVATVIILGPRVPIYALSLITLSIVYVIGTIFFSKPVRKANTKQAEQESRQTGQLADSITNIMAVKSFAAEEHESNAIGLRQQKPSKRPSVR